VFFAANLIRMESLILLLFAAGLLLHSYERRVAAAAIFFLGVVVHPALLLGATVYAAGIFWADGMVPRYLSAKGTARPVRRLVPVNAQALTIVIVSAVACAITLESVYVLYHLPTFHQHMAYQIARKANRSPLSMLLTRRGLFLIFELAFTFTLMGYLYRHTQAWRIFVRKLLPLFLLTLGLSVYATLGREIPYNVYSYAAVPATFFCLTYGCFPFSSQKTSMLTSLARGLPAPAARLLTNKEASDPPAGNSHDSNHEGNSPSCYPPITEL
jgi:hypothetical protein